MEPEDPREQDAALTEPWDDPDAEYRVLSDFIVPAAQARFDRAMSDWDALDTKALGLLALAAAVIAGLAATHESIHGLWWLPATGCTGASALFIAALWPRTADLGPDLIDFHHEMKENTPLDAARAMLEHLWSSIDHADGRAGGKVVIFWFGLGRPICIATRLPSGRSLPPVR